MSDGIHHGEQYTSGMPITGSASLSAQISAPLDTSTTVPVPTPMDLGTPIRTVRTGRAPRSATATRGNRAQAATPAPPDPNVRSLTITLPTAVAEWFEKEAAAAPFEPSVQRYIAWELRQWMAEKQEARAAEQKAKQAALDASGLANHS
jgi:hypothetical protein